MSIKSRILQVLDNKGITKYKFYKDSGITRGTLDNDSGLSEDNITKALNYLDDIDVGWLILGSENRNISHRIEIPFNEINPTNKKDSIPYYNIPVSAGKLDQFEQDHEIEGYIDIPGVNCVAFFPVLGFSMEPVVRNGDIIGIDHIDSWEILDPDQIYYMITSDNRMIKHLKYDPQEPELIQCISHNYDSFSIRRDDIKVIYKVVFCGRMV